MNDPHMTVHHSTLGQSLFMLVTIFTMTGELIGCFIYRRWNVWDMEFGRNSPKNNKLSSQKLHHNQVLTKYNTLPVSQPPFILDLAPTDYVLQNEGYPKGKDTSQIIQSVIWKLHKIQKKSTNHTSTCSIATRIRALLQEKTTFKRIHFIKW